MPPGSDHTHHGLHSLSRYINSEAAKVAGVLGTQLLMHFANLQRGVAKQSEHLHSHMAHPWRHWHLHLRLPWHRGGGAARDRSAGAGAHSRQASEAARKWLARGVAAERAFDLREALSCYQSAVALEPSNLEYICRVAKQWSDLTYEEGASTEQIVEANTKGIEYAERAIALVPQCPAGHLVSCVSRGRLALFSDNKTKVRLAKEAQEAARRALELEPSNDLAHHLMGRWHYEMAQINFMVRQLIRMFYGASLAPGSFQEALCEFQAAVDLAPDRLIHRVELGRTYMRLGRRREALMELTLGVQLEEEDVNAKLEMVEAEAMIEKLQREFDRAVEPLVWPLGGAGNGGGSGDGGASSQEQQQPPQ